MIFRPFLVVVGLTIFLPFEDFLLKWLPVSDRIYSFSRFLSEGVMYTLCAIVIFNRLLKRLSIPKSPIDGLLLCFISLSILSIFMNDVYLFKGIINLRTLIRYTAIYYILVNINIKEYQVKILLKLIILVAFIESLLGIMQYFLHAGQSKFWLPRQTDLEIEGYQKVFTVLASGLEIGAVMGTFCHSVSMALYLFISSIISSVIGLGHWDLLRRERLVIFCIYFSIFAAIGFTYSRGSLLASIMAIPLILIYLKRKKLLIEISFISLLIIGFFLLYVNFTPVSLKQEFVKVKKESVNPMENISMIFSNEYAEKTQSVRTWLLKDVGKSILMSGTLIGYSPDQETAKRKIVEASGGALQRLIAFKSFEDVYWIAILAYYGIIGLIIFFGILYRLYRCSKFVAKHSRSKTFNIIGVSMTVLVILTIPLTFLVRTFEFRTFGFYFWLLAGIMITEYRNCMDKITFDRTCTA